MTRLAPDDPMTSSDELAAEARPFSTPLFLILISATHLAYVPLAELRGLPVIPPALAMSVLLGGAYAVVAWLARQGGGFEAAINLIVGEDLGVLTAGLILGYPWAEYLRPGAMGIVVFQLALCFAEIWRRQEAGRPIVAPARLAWFVIAYALALAAYAALKPEGIWGLGAPVS